MFFKIFFSMYCVHQQNLWSMVTTIHIFYPVFYLGFFFREGRSIVSNAQTVKSRRAKSISGEAALLRPSCWIKYCFHRTVYDEIPTSTVGAVFLSSTFFKNRTNTHKSDININLFLFIKACIFDYD
jgi:hypothetical protein